MLNQWHHWKEHPRISLPPYFHGVKGPPVGTLAYLLSNQGNVVTIQVLKTPMSQEDNETHTHIVLRWRSGDLGGRVSPIRAQLNA